MYWSSSMLRSSKADVYTHEYLQHTVYLPCLFAFVASTNGGETGRGGKFKS
jgi:hypothetical protein